MAKDNKSSLAPIIVIKRIKKGGHGHHGGSWKVAYADFVTAMMAFFMLMWMMGSTTPEQKSAISDYFQNPSAIEASGGISSSMIEMGGQLEIARGEGNNPLEQNPDAPEVEDPAEDSAEAAAQKELDSMQAMFSQLKSALDTNAALSSFKDQLLIDITNEGLRIQIMDKENRPMFANGSSAPEKYTKPLFAEIVKILNQSPNKISISGHTDMTPYANTTGYSNWELSADRANAARRQIISAGLPSDKISRVVGLGSSVLYDKDNPYNPINRRINIILLKAEAEKAAAREQGSQADQANQEGRPPNSDSDAAPIEDLTPPEGQRISADIHNVNPASPDNAPQ
ncbi:MAG: flagellar motor protein MotB [Gammaproteobacteria bacterium]|nr:flagellar motor protein MotB [Gammaproteobacteria bacterium]